MPFQTGVTGVALAGGQSRRLGRDKALEPFAGTPLITRVLDRLGEVSEALLVVVANESRAAELPLSPDVRVATDRYLGKGSLGGIYSGLEAATTTWVIVVACDMPFLNVRLLEHLLSRREDHDVVVPVIDGRPEPTHAAYSHLCLPAIQRRLERDELKIIGFFDEVRVAYVPEEEVRALDPDLRSFLNVNTQRDLEQALALVGEDER